MTASRDGCGNREPVYRCYASDTLPDHPRPTRVRESIVLPWIKEEAARLRPPADLVEITTAREAKRFQLEDQRRAVGDAVTVRAYTLEEATAKVKAIEADLAALETERQIVEIPAINWGWDTVVIQKVLAEMFERPTRTGSATHPRPVDNAGVASMTIHPARRRGESILCGRPVPDRGYCGGLLAHVNETATGAVVWLTFGMIEDPPGSHFWRLSNAAKRQRARGQRTVGNTGRALTRTPGRTAIVVPVPWRRHCPKCSGLVEVTEAMLGS